MHRLASEAGALEPNTRYAYLLIARDFSATSAVAEREGEVVGFVAAYPRPDEREPTLFLWQVGVAAEARGGRIARRMVLDILGRERGPPWRWLETTVARSNAASRRLFESVARALGVPLAEREGFRAEDFGEERHEAEPLLRIGPLARPGGSHRPRASAPSERRVSWT